MSASSSFFDDVPVEPGEDLKVDLVPESTSELPGRDIYLSGAGTDILSPMGGGTDADETPDKRRARIFADPRAWEGDDGEDDMRGVRVVW